MRVPPDQSSTAAEHSASASSGSFMRSCRVTFVSRVPNRKVCTLRRFSDTACMKCRKMREYCPIEPEMSAKTTSGGCIVRLRRNFGRTKSPPVFRLEASVRRGSIMAGRLTGSKRRIVISSKGNARSAIARRAIASSVAVIWAKSFARSTSLPEAVICASTSMRWRCGSSRLSCPEKSDCETRDWPARLSACS